MAPRFDYAARRRRLDDVLQTESVDALFLGPSSDLEYLTGLERNIPTFGNVSYAHGWVGGDHRGAGRLIPDHLLDRFAFEGSPREVAAQARSLFEAGASRVEFGAPFGLRMDEGLRMLGEQVVPHFR